MEAKMESENGNTVVCVFVCVKKQSEPESDEKGAGEGKK